MKELSIEEKAKAYDKVLEWATEAHKVCDGMLKEDLEYLFPELKESEDERIRKEIIDFATKANNGVTSILANNYNFNKWIAWLEKQGKNNMGISEATKQELEDKLNKALEKETPESWNKFLGEEKPAWSKEDEKIANSIWDSIDKSVLTNYGVDEDKAFEWLSHIKDRVQLQPKQEWSEEDERIYNRICDIIHNAAFANYDVDEDGKELGEYAKIIGWLKSLKPQTTWKPSEEQIDALEDAIADAVSSIQKNMLNSLYQDIKKLKGE